MMRFCVLVNEGVSDMVLGGNSSLAGIIGLLDLGVDVIVLDVSGQKIFRKNLGIFLDKDNSFELIREFKNENKKFADNYGRGDNSGLFMKKVGDIKADFEECEFSFDEVDFVYQRLEPMKSPFPPVGEMDIEEYLREFSCDIFTKNKKYNLAINCFGDKELPIEIGEDIEVKTMVSNFDDEELVEKIFAISEDKIVLKPDNSAQSVGVFAVEFGEDGVLLNDILDSYISELSLKQVYKIKKNLDEGELSKIMKILFFIQDKKALKKQGEKFEDLKIREIDFREIEKDAKLLYNDKILIQPFFEGVKMGDIRVNLLKIDGEFRVCGVVMRRSILDSEDNFTTGLTAGGARAMRVEDVLSLEELNDLGLKINIFLEIINSKFKEKYQNIYELGLDFLIFGDGKRVFLNEVNHHCQALIPFSEALEKNSQDSFYKRINAVNLEYDGGLAMMKNFFVNLIK